MAPPLPTTDATTTTTTTSADRAKVSEDELKAAQARLHKLLLEAQERLRRERASNGDRSEASEGGVAAASLEESVRQE
jgi:ElaB/YqjD/DUF883 family membrane-anchored ribosome-binding protein